MGKRGWAATVWRVLRVVTRGAGRAVTVLLAVTAGLSDRNVGPMLSSHERPPVSRGEYRP